MIRTKADVPTNNMQSEAASACVVSGHFLAMWATACSAPLMQPCMTHRRAAAPACSAAVAWALSYVSLRQINHSLQFCHTLKEFSSGERTEGLIWLQIVFFFGFVFSWHLWPLREFLSQPGRRNPEINLERSSVPPLWWIFLPLGFCFSVQRLLSNVFFIIRMLPETTERAESNWEAFGIQ